MNQKFLIHQNKLFILGEFFHAFLSLGEKWRTKPKGLLCWSFLLPLTPMCKFLRMIMHHLLTMKVHSYN